MTRTKMFSLARHSLVLGALALALSAVPAPAQGYSSTYATGYGFGPYASGYGYGVNPYGYGFGFGGGTAAGNYLWGRSQVIQAQGQYVLDASQAAINLETARTKDLENQSNYARTYFEKQKMNQDYREAHRPARPTAEQLVRLAKSGVPGRPNRSELDQPSGIILWPDALMSRPFDNDRKAMEKLFGERTGTNYGVTSPLYGDVQRVAAGMKDDLKDRIHTMDANEYLAARKFIDRLSYEARFAPALPGVASN